MKLPHQSNQDNAMQYATDYISFGVPFQLSSENESLLAKMSEMLPLDSKKIAVGTHSAERFSLLSSARGSGYAGYIGNELTIESEELFPALEQLRQDLMVHVANHSPDRVFIHAGVVGWQGRALIFPGKSFAGKTTLVAELVKAGATYYSDEYAVVDENGNVHPYARDLQMREPGNPEQRSLAVEQIGGNVGLAPLPVGQVLFAEYVEGSEWMLQPVSNGMAVLEMMQHTIPVRRTPSRVMSTLRVMMTGATAWRSRRGEAKATAHAILTTLTEGDNISMRPGMQCVLEILRGQTGLRSVDEHEWDAALELAQKEQILPFLLFCLQHNDVALPEHVQASVKEKQRNAAIARYRWKFDLNVLIQTFNAAAIPVIPLKGPSFAQRIYGGVALRPSRDLDLLVQSGDIARAKLVLAQLGFVIYAGTEDYSSNWRRGMITVELHFNVAHPDNFHFDLDTAWKRAILGTFADQPAWELTAEDEFLFLCLHGVRHQFERLSYVLDISLAARRMLDRGSELHLRPEMDDLTTVLLLGCSMAKQLDPIRPAAWPSVGSKLQQQSMKKFADELWGRLLLNRIAPNASGWVWLRFYRRLETRPFYKQARWLRHFSVLATRVCVTDVTFAAKLGLKQTWQARLVRPLRLLLQYARRKGEA